MKTVFILLYILTNSSGGDRYESIAMRDLALCEHQRQWMQHKGIITASQCVRINYSTDT